MADQAAVAVQNARLITASRGRAALEERYRLARDLHDSAGQELFSLTLELRAAHRALDHGRLSDAAGVGRRLAVLEELAYAALRDMRGLVFELHPTLLHAEGLVAAVRREAEALAARETLHTTTTLPPERLTLDPTVELELYRLVKEALHNSVKHADATTVHVEIRQDPAEGRRLVVEIADDGVGFDPLVPSGGLGLVSMRERAERVGGRLTLESVPAGGTRVRIVVPDMLLAPPSGLDDAVAGNPLS